MSATATISTTGIQYQSTYTNPTTNIYAYEPIRDVSMEQATAYSHYITDYTDYILKAKEKKDDPHAFINYFKKVMANDKLTHREKAEKLVQKIIVNGPATIVIWADGSKTVVKANGEAFDIEKALAMAFIKRMCGNKGNYIELLHKIMKSNDLAWDTGHSEGDE